MATLAMSPAARDARAIGHARSVPAVAHIASANPLALRGMWIWLLASSNQGNYGSIVARAHLNGIGTLLIKAGDGTTVWSSQFNSTVVSEFHRAGLRVCAWQYIYGNDPIAEADVGAAAVRAGADCLMIDAESEYEGKYLSAQSYIKRLRALIGYRYPLALAGFPYIDFHPGFPYSVFLGPGGAQYNAPQMYWQDIGTSVDGVYAHTYLFNRLYMRPIMPLGQIYNGPPAAQIRRFRLLSRAYGAANVSWWDWQEGTPGAFHALSQSVGSLSGFAADTSVAGLSIKAKGDLVVWAQLHLLGSGISVAVDGDFGPATLSAVKRFQAAHRLTVDGVIGPATWSALLRQRIARVRWVLSRSRLTAILAADGSHIERVPKSAKLRAKHYEIPRSLGSGRP
jgi:Putative peptidoglycan binding domain